jgi:hypothetical protein
LKYQEKRMSLFDTSRERGEYLGPNPKAVADVGISLDCFMEPVNPKPDFEIPEMGIVAATPISAECGQRNYCVKRQNYQPSYKTPRRRLA